MKLPLRTSSPPRSLYVSYKRLTDIELSRVIQAHLHQIELEREWNPNIFTAIVTGERVAMLRLQRERRRQKVRK